MSHEATEVLRQVRELLAEMQQGALENAEMTHKNLREAQRQYEEALMRTDELGISPSVVARRLGMSEAAVRLYIKRRKD